MNKNSSGWGKAGPAGVAGPAGPAGPTGPASPVPTLAQVLAAGADANGIPITGLNSITAQPEQNFSATGGSHIATGTLPGVIAANAGTNLKGGQVNLTGGDGLNGGASLSIAGGNDDDDHGGDLDFQGGSGRTAKAGGTIHILAGTGDSGNDTGAELILNPGSGTGTTGKPSFIPQIVSFQAGTPIGGGYKTPLVRDTTAVTGALYAWNGTDYAKVAPV